MRQHEDGPLPTARGAAGSAVWLVAKLAGGLALAAGLVYFYLRGSDLGELASELGRAQPGYLALAVAVALAGFGLRAVRWSAYLRPVRRVSTRESFEILMIGYMTSTFLPGRVGDIVVRPALMARDQRIPLATTLATIAVERLFDTLMVVGCFGAYLVVVAGSTLDIEPTLLARAQKLGAVVMLAGVAAVGFLIALRSHKERCLELVSWLLRPLPPRIAAAVRGQVESFAGGLNLFADGRNALSTVVQTMVIWITVAGSLWLVALAFGLGAVVRPLDGYFLMGLGALGVAVPVPGGIGSFHLLLSNGLGGLGVSNLLTAKAAAFMMWAISFVPVVVVGLAALGRRGERLGLLRGAVAEVGPS